MVISQTTLQFKPQNIGKACATVVGESFVGSLGALLITDQMRCVSVFSLPTEKSSLTLHVTGVKAVCLLSSATVF